MNNYTVSSLISKGEFKCGCGKTHKAHLKDACICENAVEKLPEYIFKLGAKKAFVLADKNTLTAGRAALSVLENNSVDFVKYVYSEERIEPDDRTVGRAFLNFDYSCDIVVGIGSGVINDICKIVSRAMNLPFIIVATAPSMDGYASSTSSVIRDGLKVSVDSRCPDVVIGDLDILCKAPVLMSAAGLGDMLAKYISICEWRIGSVVTGEYYCEEVASIIRFALSKCVENAHKITSGDKQAVKSVMEGLVISGIAADYAGVSRPVSGVEHYFSHIWDMRAVEFGTPISLHGIQCAAGTLLALKGYELLKNITPDKDYALSQFEKFNRKEWTRQIKKYLGAAGDKMIENTEKCELYNSSFFKSRIDKICENKDEILKIINEELPDYDYILNILKAVNAPVTTEEFGIDPSTNALTFKMTKDIRDKYILSSLAFDMGVLDKLAEKAYN
ncbi:MAG: sn-glycerol-1-phosphate dehydrogenase [Clostridia bacterium]|nr:sn-glycerol-1-phosphate dehydrogenase [Clostridia bacterium]